MKLSQKTKEFENYLTIKSILEYAVWMVHDIELTGDILPPQQLLTLENKINQRIREVKGFIDLAVKKNQVKDLRLKKIIDYYIENSYLIYDNFDIEMYLSELNEDIQLTKMIEFNAKHNELLKTYQQELQEDDPEYMLIVVYEYYSSVLEMLKCTPEDFEIYEKQMFKTIEVIYDASEYLQNCIQEEKYKDYLYKEFRGYGVIDDSNQNHLDAIIQNWQNILYEWLFIFEAFGKLYENGNPSNFETLFNEGYARLIRNAWEIASHTLEICRYNVPFDFKLLVQHEEVLEYVQ